MAITLEVTLTDQEQARLLAIASVISPSATPVQIKEWAEKQAKDGLRQSVIMAWNDHQQSLMSSNWPTESELPEPPPEVV